MRGVVRRQVFEHGSDWPRLSEGLPKLLAAEAPGTVISDSEDEQSNRPRESIPGGCAHGPMPVN
jgi:hypothetical protein